MKVLLFVRDLAVGGSQRQLAVLAAGLSRRGHDVAVAVLYAGGALETALQIARNDLFESHPDAADCRLAIIASGRIV